MSLYLPTWIIKRMLRNPMGDCFADVMLKPFDANALDRVTDRRVKWILFTERWRRATEPYIRIFKLTGDVIRGRYWQPFKKVRGNTDPASGGGSGAAGQPAAQFAYSAGTFPPAGPGGVSQATMPPTSSVPAFEDAGIRAGEVVAYRNWILKDGILHSVFQRGFRWMPGDIVEGDAAGGDGIHAFKSVLLMAEYGAQTDGDIVVTGTVELWGEVYEHERGYRASKAAIKTIDNSHEYDAKALRKLYGLTRSRKKKVK
jgi:hypothetical protein